MGQTISDQPGQERGGHATTLRAGAFRRAVELMMRPYVYRELPGWGRLYGRFVGGHTQDAFWQAAGVRRIRGKLHGYEMELDLGQWSQRHTYFVGRFYELPLQLVMQRILRPGDCFYDVGANLGMISLLAARLVGPQGLVVSFEPNQACCSAIQRLIERNGIGNVRVEQTALGDASSVATLSIPDVNSGEASLLPSQYGDESVTAVSVRVMRGDDFVAATRPPHVIKVDVEGYERPVLDGFGATIEERRPIIITEVSRDHLDRAGADPDDVVSLMKRHGYEGYTMHAQRKGLGWRPALRRLDEHDLAGRGRKTDVLWTHGTDERVQQV